MGIAGAAAERLVAKVLLVEDDGNARFGVSALLRKEGFRVIEADSCASAVKCLEERPDVIVTDMRLPDGDALELMARAKRVDPTLPVFIVTGFGTIDSAVRAVKLGAEDFLTKPVDLEALGLAIDRALARREERRASGVRRAGVPVPLEGRSDAMRRVMDQVDKLRDADCSVLLLGETGTGKSVLARRIHAVGGRKSEPFVEVSCPGLAKEFVESELFGHERGAFTGAHSAKVGLFEAAHGGSAFLDEIGDVDLAVQPKLLKVLEERKFRRMGDVRERTVDVRLLAATHQDLFAAIYEKRFRADLYYRISTVTLTVPALRDRREDILPLARHFLGPGIEIDGDAQTALGQHPWPGNLREMKNVIERARISSAKGVVRACDLRFDRPSETLRAALSSALGSRPGLERTPTLGELQRDHIQSALVAEGGRVEAAARRLGIPRSTLYQRMKEYGILAARSKRAGSRSDPPASE